MYVHAFFSQKNHPAFCCFLNHKEYILESLKKCKKPVDQARNRQ